MEIPGNRLSRYFFLKDFAISRYATVATGIRCFFASAFRTFSSVSANITATRFLRESGDCPEPEPFGRPAPSRLPPQDPFFAFAFFFFAAI